MNNELFVYWIPGQARNDGAFDCRSGFKILCDLCVLCGKKGVPCGCL